MTAPAARKRHSLTGEFLPIDGPLLGYNARNVPGGSPNRNPAVPLPMVVEVLGMTWAPTDAEPSGASIGYALAVETLVKEM